MDKLKKEIEHSIEIKQENLFRATDITDLIEELGIAK